MTDTSVNGKTPSGKDYEQELLALEKQHRLEKRIRNIAISVVAVAAVGFSSWYFPHRDYSDRLKTQTMQLNTARAEQEKNISSLEKKQGTYAPKTDANTAKNVNLNREIFSIKDKTALEDSLALYCSQSIAAERSQINSYDEGTKTIFKGIDLKQGQIRDYSARIDSLLPRLNALQKEKDSLDIKIKHYQSIKGVQ